MDGVWCLRRAHATTLVPLVTSVTSATQSGYAVSQEILCRKAANGQADSEVSVSARATQAAASANSG